MNPKTGAASGRFAAHGPFSSAHIKRRWTQLLCIGDVGEIGWTRVRIVKRHRAAGTIISSKNLEDDVWFLTSGNIKSEMEAPVHLAAAVR